jgi:glycyl-tRNA synthetase beta chain
MSELLLEIFCEEIPARMQGKAAADLGRMLGKALKDAGFTFENVNTFAGPRRLTLVIDNLPAKSPDISEERKGPRVGAPEQALAGFMRGAGVSSLDECEQREDKKGKFWVAKLEKPGRSAAEVLAEAVPQLMADFPWPKSMKWGTGSFRWVRPLHSIICLLDGQVVPFEVAGIATGAQTHGHRQMGPGPFPVTSFADYRAQLEGPGHVMLDASDRKAKISEQIAQICEQNGLKLVEDAVLLDEVAGLAEWPMTLLGDMDEAFLDLPPEVITLSMAKHQKYFSVTHAKTGKLAPHFLVVANLDAPDGGKAIAAGNARVLTARLADARHFWDMDREKSLESRVDALRDVVFHQKLGSVYDKAERVAALAKYLAPIVGANPELAERAAWLAKADLTTQMVVEFTSLQGVMGRYYALADGRCFEGAGAPPQHEEDRSTGKSPHPEARPKGASKDQPLCELPSSEVTQIADAIRDHYKPQGPTDEIPTDPVSVAVALADKLDTLVGFWAIDEKPTGSKDPYALRRAALGVIRIERKNNLKLFWHGILVSQFHKFGFEVYENAAGLADELMYFFRERLKVQMRDEGERHDLVDAVFSSSSVGISGGISISELAQRVFALSAFLKTDSGERLLGIAKRATGIVKSEEKKKNETFGGAVDLDMFGTPEERDLFNALEMARTKSAKAILAEDYTAAMKALVPLREPIDAFFEAVMVNDEDAQVRQNRLRLLSGIRAALAPVADFDKISG